MLYQQSIEKARKHRLFGLADFLQNLRTNPAAQTLGPEEIVGMGLDAEDHFREDRRLVRMTKAAGFRMQASPEDIHLDAARGIERPRIASLLTCDWVQLFQHLLILGATGLGKTYLACALGHQAVRLGYSVKYWRVPRLFDEIGRAYSEHTLELLRRRMKRPQLLILDDWGLATPCVVTRNELLEILDDRAGSGSILVTSQLPVDLWHDQIGDPTLADAILDRMLHNAHRLELKGASLRKTRPL